MDRQAIARKIVSSMLQSAEYADYLADRLGNDLFINDPDRAERIYDAAEDGRDGSTHQEAIDDMRSYWQTRLSGRNWRHNIDRVDMAVCEYFDSLESRLETNGTLFTQVG